MKKYYTEINLLKVGDTIVTPGGTYSPQNKEDVIFTTVEEIFDENGQFFIVDSDSDIIPLKELGLSFFLTQKDLEWCMSEWVRRFENGSKLELKRKEQEDVSRWLCNL